MANGPNLTKYEPAAQAPLSTNLPQQDGPDKEEIRKSRRKLLTPLDMTTQEFHAWETRIKRARERVKEIEKSADILLKEYLPTVKATDDPEVLKVNVHFRNVHTKIGQLFYRSPQVQCIPKGPANDQKPVPGQQFQASPADENVIGLKQAVLNWYLGPDAVNSSRLMDECLFDVLAWWGLGCVKIGYRATLVTIQEPVMQADPNFRPQTGNVLNISGPQPQQVPVLGSDNKPVMRSVQVPIYEDWYARRFSPKKLLFNDDLRSTRFDEEATWMGWDFALPKSIAQREFALSDDEVQKLSEDDRVFKHKDQESVKETKNYVTGVELWPKTSIFRPDAQPHPLALDHLVFIDGVTSGPVVNRPSPDQQFDERGRLTLDSMIGFPIHVITIRDLADSPFPPSDSAFTNSQAKELNTSRRQSVELRNRAIGKQFADAQHVEDGEEDALINGDVGTIIKVKPGALVAAGGPQGILANTTQPTATMDDYRTAAMLETDMEKTLGISANQLSAPMGKIHSATEAAVVEQSFAGRMEKEQRRAVDGWLGIAKKLDALLMRYGTETQWVPILGTDGARKFVAWNNKLISGRYSYDILPDSSWRMDAAQYLRMLLSWYNLTARDPMANRVPVLRRIATQLGLDASQVVLTPEQIALMQQPEHGGKAQPVAAHENRQTGQTPNGAQGGNTPSRTLMGG